MDLYHLFFFATFLMVLAKPVPETSLDRSLLDLLLAEALENWSFVQRDPADSVNSDSLQTAALDANQQDQPVSFQIPAVNRVQQDQSGPFQVPTVNQIQQDQSGSFQVAAADRIEPVNPYSDSVQIESEDDPSSYLAPMTTDDDYLLAATPKKPKPKKPKTQVRLKAKVCPSYILPARACCSGPVRLITGVKGLGAVIPGGDLILGYTLVTHCFAYKNGCNNDLIDWCCMYLFSGVEGYREGHICVKAGLVVI